MKKFLVVFAALLLMMGLAGQAKAAYWQEGDLIRVVYDAPADGASAYEQVTDLGSISSISNNPTAYTDTAGYNLNTTFSRSGMSGATNGYVYVGYFAENGSAPGNPNPLQFWTSGTANGHETNSGYNGAVSIIGGAYNVVHEYSMYAYGGYAQHSWQISGANLAVPFSDNESYYFALDGNGTVTGSFGYWYASGPGDGEKALPLNGGQITQSLYDWQNPGVKQTIGGSLYVYTTVDAAGDVATSFGPEGSAAPIPPSVLLFGSGLLGLIGIGRKNLFNS
jgi:hypothetical protein